MRKLLIFFLFTSSLTFSQHTKDEVVAYQKNLNTEYLTPGKSPLKEEEIAVFKGLNFYEYTSNFVVNAVLEKLDNQKAFQMPTSSGRTRRSTSA